MPRRFGICGSIGCGYNGLFGFSPRRTNGDPENGRVMEQVRLADTQFWEDAEGHAAESQG